MSGYQELVIGGTLLAASMVGIHLSHRCPNRNGYQWCDYQSDCSINCSGEGNEICVHCGREQLCDHAFPHSTSEVFVEY